MSEYTDWQVEEGKLEFVISARREGGVNPALTIRVLKSAGAVTIEGSPELTVIGCNGRIQGFKGELRDCEITSNS